MQRTNPNALDATTHACLHTSGLGCLLAFFVGEAASRDTLARLGVGEL